MDGTKIINKVTHVGVLPTWLSASPHSHTCSQYSCRRQSMLAISEYLLAHLMSVNGFQEDVSHNLFRTKVRLAGLNTVRFPSNFFPFPLLNVLLQFFLLLSQTSPSHQMCHREQLTHCEISKFFQHPRKFHPAPEVWIHPGSLGSTNCAVPTAACPSSLQLVLMYTVVWEQILLVQTKATSCLSFSVFLILSKTNCSPLTDLHPLLQLACL